MNASTIAQQFEAEVANAPRRYRELINPSRQSQPDDIDTLKLLMLQLGITPAQVSEDIAALQRVAELSRSDEERAVMVKASLDAQATLKAYDRETEELIKQRKEGRVPLDQAAARAWMAVRQVTEDNLEVSRLRHGHRLAFGLPPRPETPNLTGSIQTIQERGVAPAPSYRHGEEPFGPLPGENDIRTMATYPHGGNHRMVGHIPDPPAEGPPASDADVAASLGLV